MLVLVLVLLIGVLSGLEIAYLGANRLKIELAKNKGRWSASIASQLMQSPDRFYSTNILAINVLIVLFSTQFEILANEFVGSYYPEFLGEDGKLGNFALVLGGSVLLLILGEFIPKVVFTLRPTEFLLFLSPFLVLLQWLLYPLVLFVEFLSKRFIQLISKGDKRDMNQKFTRRDLYEFVSEGASHSKESTRDNVDTEIIRNAISFRNVRVEDCMIPRTEMVAIEVTEPIEALRELSQREGHSRIPIYRGEIDNIIGYAHVIELFSNPKSIDKIVMPITFTTMGQKAQMLLKELNESNRSIAIVLDEFGGTAGMVTTEDLLEEIIGEIMDEFDDDEVVIARESDGSYIVSGRTEVELINQKMSLTLPLGDYETLNGLFIAYFQGIPKEGDSTLIEPYCLEVIRMEKLKIAEMRIRIES